MAEGWKLSVVDINTVAGVTKTVPGITAWGCNPNLATWRMAVDGNVDPRFVAINTGQPTVTFTTTDLAGMLGTVGISGIPITTDVDDAGIDFYLQALSDGAERVAGANQHRIRSGQGILIPRRMRASQGQAASIEYEFVATSTDGLTDPFAMAASVSLPSYTAPTAYHTLGPVFDNTTEIGQIQDVTIDFGIKLKIHRSSGLPYPDLISIDSREPSIDITLTKGTYIQGLTAFTAGKPIATGLKVYFRKITANGTRVATGTAEHIKVTATQGIILPAQHRAGENDVVSYGLRVEPSYDGSNAVLQLATTSAIA